MSISEKGSFGFLFCVRVEFLPALNKVSLKPFQRLARAAGVGGRAPQSAKLLRLGDADTHASHMCQSSYRRFLFDSFFFCACICKRKSGMEQIFFVLAVGGAWVLTFYFRVTFLLSYFCVTKSTKSQQRELSPLFANLPRVHELVAQAMRGKCVRQRAK